jgi:SAM-dependent methyltransferase
MPAKHDIQFDDCCQAFAESYEVSNLPAMREVERSVLGCDYGGTSWTTSAQAQQIVELLNLQPGQHVLDIGAGSGWPGLYLADTSGCAVTLLDLPVNALAKARERAREDGIDDRVITVAASGAALPFADDSFEAISHSDVLCCLPEKIEMLEECRRVATDGANMLFSVIAVAPQLTAIATGRSTRGRRSSTRRTAIRSYWRIAAGGSCNASTPLPSTGILSMHWLALSQPARH